MVLEIINQMSKNQKSSLIVWNTVVLSSKFQSWKFWSPAWTQICTEKYNTVVNTFFWNDNLPEQDSATANLWSYNSSISPMIAAVTFCSC